MTSSSQQSTAIENQTTFCLWFHYCYLGCTSPWHDQSSLQTTYLLSNFETNLNVDTSTINSKDVKVWRLDLLNNGDGDETKGSPRAEDVAAEASLSSSTPLCTSPTINKQLTPTPRPHNQLHLLQPQRQRHL